MITTTAFATWLESQLGGTPVEVGPNEPDLTGAFVLVTANQGGGTGLNELIERQGFTVRTTGPQEDYQAAEDLAFQIDGVVLDGARTTIGGLWVAAVERAGGRKPAPAEVSDLLEQSHLEAGYVLDVEVS